MKNITPGILVILFLFSTGCKKECNQTATMVRDCTGTYLHLDGKDFRVCNLEKAESFPDGVAVNVTFKRIKKCKGSTENDIVCAMYHENEGWIEVLEIK